MSRRRRIKAGSKPGVRTIGVIADTLGRHHHRLHVVQVEAGVLHVDKGGVEAGEPDDLDDLRVGDAADMGPEARPPSRRMRFTRFSLMMPSSPRSMTQARPPGRFRALQIGDDHVGVHDIAEDVVEGG